MGDFHFLCDIKTKTLQKHNEHATMLVITKIIIIIHKRIISFKIQAGEGQAFLNKKLRWEVGAGRPLAQSTGPGFQERVQGACPCLPPDELG